MGNNYAREGHMLDARMVELVKNHLDLSIYTNVNDFDNVDCMIYNESSADGYDLWVVTNDSRNVNICENVYYYENDLANAFEDQVRWGDRTFYICEYVYEDVYHAPVSRRKKKKYLHEHRKDYDWHLLTSKQKELEKKARYDKRSKKHYPEGGTAYMDSAMWLSQTPSKPGFDLSKLFENIFGKK